MTTSEQLESALRDVRLSNARRISRVRAIGVGAFFLTILIKVCLWSDDFWVNALLPLGIYFFVSLMFAFGSRLSPTVLWLSRFAVPAFDMPAVFAIQYTMIRATDGENAANIAEFSISLFVCLLMLSAYTLNARFILVSMVLAIIFEQILEGYSSGIGPGGWVFSPVVLGLATWICVFAGRSRLELIETVVQANARRARLQRYFSPGVGELLEEQEADTLARGKDCELTIIFIDIRGFTSLSEQLSTREVVELLNSYHAHMVEAIFRHGGTLDKYLGDGLIAYFNAPVDQPDHAERAVACAFEMERRLIMFNEERSKEGKVTIKMGIGVHTGRAIVGDIGAPHRREFTAIGSAVNEASRLEGMTKELKRSMVVSEATAQLVTDVPWDELGRYPIRGRVEPLLLFAPKKS